MIQPAEFDALRHRAAMLGWQIWRTVEDGASPETYFTRKGEQVFQLPSIHDINSFLAYLVVQSKA